MKKTDYNCLFKCTNYRDKKTEIGIKWNDKNLNIKWPTNSPKLSKKDKNNISFKVVEPKKREFVIKSYSDNFLKS